MKIHVIGAGNVGGHLIHAATRAGHVVTVGVRSPEKIRDLLTETGASLSNTPDGADVVVSTIPHAAAVAILPTYGLTGYVLVDASNPLVWEGGPVHMPPDGYRSGAARIQDVVPGAKVVKAFNTFGAEHITGAADQERPLDCVIAGDDDGAKASVAELLRSLNMRPVDLGLLRNAATAEHLAVAWIQLAMPGGWGRGIELAVLGGPS